MHVRALLVQAIALGLITLCGQVFGQSYPTKTIRYVVPFAPGGATDTLARVVSQKLTAAWGVPVIVENRAGAGGNLGTAVVAKSPPDGHTLLMTINSHAINASLYKDLPYDPIRDFAPVTLVATSPNILVVHLTLPAENVKGLIALAKSRPGELTFASAGAGSGAHLAGELFKAMTGVDMIHVPYKGAGALIGDLVGAQVSMSFVALPVAHPQVQAGKLRALAVTSAKRSSLVPAIPAVAEAGLHGFDVVSWFGTLVPAGTPGEIVAKLNSEIAKSLQSADVKDKMNALGLELHGRSAEEFGNFIKAEWAQWDKLIKSLGIRVD
jgi:tripartite-type tricarboxylate transporter receptor subunit TctC